MKLPLDSYALRARFFPAALVLLPAFLGIFAWFPFDSLAGKSAVAAISLAAVAMLLSHLARDLGKRRESDLFQSWDGPPTTRFLRHRDRTLPEETKARYLARIIELVPGIELPSSRSERARPDRADGIYASSVDWLREKTRDRSKFPLVFEENVNYGFRRNLWAMRPAGVASSACGLAAGGSRILFDSLAGTTQSPESVVAICVSALMLTLWLLRIRQRWVAQSADAYARRLLASCEEL